MTIASHFPTHCAARSQPAYKLIGVVPRTPSAKACRTILPLAFFGTVSTTKNAPGVRDGPKRSQIISSSARTTCAGSAAPTITTAAANRSMPMSFAGKNRRHLVSLAEYNHFIDQFRIEFHTPNIQLISNTPSHLQLTDLGKITEAPRIEPTVAKNILARDRINNISHDSQRRSHTQNLLPLSRNLSAVVRQNLNDVRILCRNDIQDFLITANTRDDITTDPPNFCSATENFHMIERRNISRINTRRAGEFIIIVKGIFTPVIGTSRINSTK